MMHRRSAPPSEPGFALRIGQLVIDGFAAGEARAIGAAFERELARILADGTSPFAAPRRGDAGEPISVDRLDAGTLSRPPDASPQAVGAAAARAIVGRLHGVATGASPAPRSVPRGRK
jgi:hypothetical protein